MARRVFVHIGTPKSGTTYLQSLWWRNAATLRERGLLLPGGNARVQFRGAAVVRASAEVLKTMSPRQLTSWDRIVAQTHEWDRDILISQEQLVETSAKRAAQALEQLGAHGAEMHVMITVRDLVRQVPSAWQQRVKHGSDITLRRFVEDLTANKPAQGFWRHQDVPAILKRWGAGLDPAHVHVLPLPRPGAPRDQLWLRTCDLLGIDDTGLDLTTSRANATLAPAEIAFLREVNQHFPTAPRDVATSRRLRGFFEPRLGGERPTEHLLIPEDVYPWFVNRGNQIVEELTRAPWNVVGDLEDLRPSQTQGPGVDPDAIAEEDVLDVALDFLARRLEEPPADAGS